MLLHKNKSMFRRVVAISLMFLANIVLLAVTVVPHHHHGDMICFTVSHCCGHEHDTDCSHNEHNPSHAHEHHGDAGCCNVEEWLLPNIEPNDKHSYFCYCVTCDSGHDLFISIIPQFLEFSSQTECLPFRQAPFEETYISVYVSQTLGLRAPPFC